MGGPILDKKFGKPFEDKGDEESGKVFRSMRRSPAYEGVSAVISPGEDFKILCYYEQEGIYHLINLSRHTDGDAYENAEGVIELIGVRQ